MRRRPSSSSGVSWNQPSNTMLIVVGIVFFVLMVVSNQFSDYKMLAFFGGSSPFVTSSNDATLVTCDNTKQGKYWVTDDRGFVCRRHELLGNGCCKPSEDIEPYSCKYCNQTAECCVEYEYCISCCLHPDNGLSISSMKMVQENPAFQSNNNFEYCKARCRTSSESVLFDKEYRSVHKYCYGTKAPSREADIGIDHAKYEALYASVRDTENTKNNGQMKKAVVQAPRGDETLVFLDLPGSENNLEIVPINTNLKEATMLFGLLGGNGDTSAASHFIPSYMVLLLPLLLLSFGFTCVWTQTNSKKMKIE